MSNNFHLQMLKKICFRPIIFKEQVARFLVATGGGTRKCHSSSPVSALLLLSLLLSSSCSQHMYYPLAVLMIVPPPQSVHQALYHKYFNVLYSKFTKNDTLSYISRAPGIYAINQYLLKASKALYGTTYLKEQCKSVCLSVCLLCFYVRDAVCVKCQ